jgi:glutamine synthetase
MIYDGEQFALTNPLTLLIGKTREDFTRADLLKIIIEKKIERITFHYTALDGKIKELKIPITSRHHAETILAEGERVSGTFLFKDVLDDRSADLYVVPLYKSAFLNPFDSGSLDFVCRYINPYGERASFAPDNILHNALTILQEKTGISLYAMGELECYLHGKESSSLFPMNQRSGYHASAPFIKTGELVNEMLKHLTQVTGSVKYAHHDIGSIAQIKSDYDELNGRFAEQIEFEFLPTPIDEMGDILVLARWVIRNVAYQRGYGTFFAPKLDENQEGNGLHIQMQLMKDGKSIMIDETNNLSKEARMLIGGLCHFLPSLSAFGNIVPSSYIRLNANKCYSTVCWSDSPNTAIRVPSAWTKVNNIAQLINPQQTESLKTREERKVVELRSPDGSSNSHLLLAAITMAALWGLTNQDMALDICDNSMMTSSSLSPDYSLDFDEMATSCAEASEMLLRVRSLYEKDGVFPAEVISHIAKVLENYNDRDLMTRLAGMTDLERAKEINRILHRDIHKH